MSYQNIISDIDRKNFQPVYFLHGTESFFIELVEKYFINNTLPEDERDFNQHVLYAKDHELEALLKLAQQFPMMGERQLIVVKEAQNYRSFEALEKYLKQPMEQTVLVFSYKGKALTPTKAGKLKAAKLMLSKPLYDNQVPEWIQGQVQVNELTIEPKATALLSEFLGNDLSKIANELAKLKIILPKGALISTDVIEKHIGISKEFNVFELLNAVAHKDIVKCTRIVDYFSKNEKNHPLVVTIGSLFTFFNRVLLTHFAPSSSPDVLSKVLKMNRFFIKDFQVASIKYSRKQVAENIHVLMEYDLKSKGVRNASVGDGELLKELIFKLVK